MTIRVLYFAAVRDLLGLEAEEIALPAEVATVDALAQWLGARYPALAPRLGHVRFARNEAFARGTDPVASGDVIALIPPVAGG